MSNNQRVRIGLCADTHFWPTNAFYNGSHGSLQLQPWSEQLQTTLLAELENAQLDYVIHMGDVTCGGGVYDMPREQFYTALDRTHQAYNQLSARIYALPGNHDCPPGGGNWAYFEKLWALQPGLGEIIDTPMARLILLNTQGHSAQQIEAAKPTDPVYGWVNDAELARLEAGLATAGTRPVLLFTHQLLRPWSAGKPWENFYEIRNPAPVLALIERYGNVRAVFQAHAHRLDVQKLDVGAQPCYFIVLPAIIEYPLGWLSLELTASVLQMSLQRLPLPDLADLSRYSGEGQLWRSGHAEWAHLTIELT